MPTRIIAATTAAVSRISTAPSSSSSHSGPVAELSTCSNAAGAVFRSSPVPSTARVSAFAAVVACSQPHHDRFAATNPTTSRGPSSATVYRVCTVW